MDFKTKDLLVTVLPRADRDLARICLLRTRICFSPTICPPITRCWCSFHTPCRPCSVFVSIAQGCFLGSCGAGGSACDPTQFCAATDPWVIESKEDLVTLRAELQDTLKRLDEVEKQGLPSGVGSLAEAESLERSLSEALEQVRAMKKGLKK